MKKGKPETDPYPCDCREHGYRAMLICHHKPLIREWLTRQGSFEPSFPDIQVGDKFAAPDGSSWTVAKTGTESSTSS